MSEVVEALTAVVATDRVRAPPVREIDRAGRVDVVEVLEGGLMLGPTVIAKNGDLSRQHVTNRLSILIAYEFVERAEDGYYQITDRGRLWLEGEIDASELEPE